MAEEKKNVVDELEEKSLKELDSFREEDNEENEKVVEIPSISGCHDGNTCRR